MKKRENPEPQTETDDFEIIMGDDSNLNISDVGDYVNDLRPKKHDNAKKVVIPKVKKKK